MKLNKLKMLGICALLAVLLTACGTKAAVQDDNQMAAQTDASGETSGDTAAENNAPRATPDPNAMLMMTTFRGLIQMDKAEGLAITKEQAEPMITIVQDAISKGELTTEVQAQLEAKLTADQKKFLTENAAKRPQRNGSGNANGDAPQGGQNGDAPQGGPNGDAPPGDPNGDAPQGGQNGDAPQGSPGPRPSGNGGGGGFGGGGNFQNIGPQLLELLQAKLK